MEQYYTKESTNAITQVRLSTLSVQKRQQTHTHYTAVTEHHHQQQQQYRYLPDISLFCSVIATTNEHY